MTRRSLALAAGVGVTVGSLRTAELYAGTVAVFAVIAATAAYALTVSRRSPAVVESRLPDPGMSAQRLDHADLLATVHSNNRWAGSNL